MGVAGGGGHILRKAVYTETVQIVIEQVNSIFCLKAKFQGFTQVESTKLSTVTLKGKPQDIRIFKEVLSILIRQLMY